MGKYEEDKDVLLLDMGANKTETMWAELRSYDGGDAKISVKKTVGDKGRVTQVIRLTPEDAEELGQFLLDLAAAAPKD